MKHFNYSKSIFFVFICLVLLSSCYHNEFSTSKQSVENNTQVNFTNLESAALYGGELIGIDTCSAEEKQIQSAITYIRKNNLEKADSILVGINTNDSTLNRVLDFLQAVTSNLYKKYNISKPNSILLNNHPQKFRFEDNRIFVDVSIHGKKYNFLVDNGYKTSVFNASLKDISQHKAVDTSIAGSIDWYGRSSKTDLYIIDSLSFANIQVKDLLVQYPHQENSKYDGVIGWDILSKHDVRIDFVNRNIVLLESNPVDLDTNYYYSWMQIPCYYTVTCDGYESRMILDLGANISFLFQNLFDSYPIKKQVLKTTRVKFTTAHSTESLEVEILEDFCLNISGYNFSFSKIMLADKMNTLSPITLGTLGCDLWQKGRIRLDYKNGIFKYEED